jgi:hypothetical protein
MGRCKGAGDDAEPRLIFRCRDVGLVYALKDSLTGSKAVDGRERESGYDKPAGSMAAAYWSLCRGVWLREAIITVVGPERGTNPKGNWLSGRTIGAVWLDGGTRCGFASTNSFNSSSPGSGISRAAASGLRRFGCVTVATEVSEGDPDYPT